MHTRDLHFFLSPKDVFDQGSTDKESEESEEEEEEESEKDEVVMVSSDEMVSDGEGDDNRER